MASLAQREAQKRYDAKNRRKFTINLNYNTDADLIAYIESWDNIQRGFKQLLWREIDRITKRRYDYMKGYREYFEVNSEKEALAKWHELVNKGYHKADIYIARYNGNDNKYHRIVFVNE